jgi:ABC-type multidrug transport system fused ATPase/permease subunit
MDCGRIAEQGSHQELLDRRGLYHALYNSQFTAPGR